MADTTDMALPPITAEEPCGPDLETAEDRAFTDFTNTHEQLLPSSYFAFKRETIDFPAAFRAAAELKKRTQDLRLNLLTAKLAILNRDFYRFAAEIGEIAWLLTNRWDEVHPQAQRGKYAARLAQLSTIEDIPVVIFPLQYATILRGDREGPLSYRAVMVSVGEANLREEEKLPNAGAIDRMITSIDVGAIVKLCDTLAKLQQDIEAIAAITLARIDAKSALTFKALPPLLQKMEAFAQGALARRDPSRAKASAAPGAPTPEEGRDEAPARPANFASLADVDAALASALGYFQANEPSSPALLLIAQARATLGKNLYEVMRLIAPRHAENARVFVGSGAGAFSIPVSSLQDAPPLDFSSGEAPPAATRKDAFGIMEQVAAHLRNVEPSNPAPYLLDRARALATRDFLSLLDEVFPSDDLDSMKNGH